MVESESDDDGAGGGRLPTPDGGKGGDGSVDPLATPRRRETLRVLAGRRLLSGLDVDESDDAGADGDGGDGTEGDDAGTAAGEAPATETSALEPGAVVVGVDTLVDEVVARERAVPGRGSGDADHHRQVSEALRSDHLPALDTADVVAYEADAGTVTYDGDLGVEARLHLR